MDTGLLEALREKAGGDYRLVTIFTKRLRELARGLPPLIKTKSADPWRIVAEELLRGKLELLTGEKAEKARRELAALAAAPETKFRRKVVHVPELAKSA